MDFSDDRRRLLEEETGKMSTKTPLPTVNEKVTESVSRKACFIASCTLDRALNKPKLLRCECVYSI